MPEVVEIDFTTKFTDWKFQLDQEATRHKDRVKSYVQYSTVSKLTRKSCVDRIWQNFVQCPEFFLCVE